MSARLRAIISCKAAELLGFPPESVAAQQISGLLEFRKVVNELELHLPLGDVQKILQKDPASLVSSEFKSASVLQVQQQDDKLRFRLCQPSLTNNVLLEAFAPTKTLTQTLKSVIVEFSSPNIAKPFHVGHLRSTIIGNFVAEINEFKRNKVVRVNYLGDWGTQFGLLAVGVELLKFSDEQIKENPIALLYKAYVFANSEIEKDKSVHDRARKIFSEMESQTSDSPTLKRWQNYRDYTVTELQTIYKRLGISFDEYAWESQYTGRHIDQILTAMATAGLLSTETDGRRVAHAIGRRIPIVKSDGTSLYLTRDLAAAIDRGQRYNFDEMIYVVDNAQTDHFAAMFEIIDRIDTDHRISGSLRHVKFGRVRGMSTRTGQVVFLQDVLDEARNRMRQKQIATTTTKINLDELDDETADILGISAVIVNDLKQRRQRDYNFEWTKALQANGDTGIKLQYTHSRLCSLEEQNLAESVVPNANLLPEPEAIAVVHEIARFSEVIDRAHLTLEACVLVNYLFVLCNSVSRALKRLSVKNAESSAVAAQRLLLFRAARCTLASGMQILGLQPLRKM